MGGGLNRYLYYFGGSLVSYNIPPNPILINKAPTLLSMVFRFPAVCWKQVAMVDVLGSSGFPDSTHFEWWIHGFYFSGQQPVFLLRNLVEKGPKPDNPKPDNPKP